MPLHPLAEQFASVADAYDRARPDYAPAVVGAVAAELRLGAGARVLDLGAGTGKLSRALKAHGLDLVAVEPLASLRELLAINVGADCVLDGLAEAIPLPDRSVDAVTVADAFHWFDHAAALAEIRRVLKAGGGLAVLSTVPDWTGASWADELGKLVMSLRPKHPHFDGPAWQDAVRAAGGWTPPREIRVTTFQPTSTDRIVDHLSTMSWIAAMPDAERLATLARMRELVGGGETPAELPLHVVAGLTQLG